MRDVMVFHGDVIHVIAEPGDMTRYEYLAIPRDNECFFVPWRNDFPYPLVLNLYEVYAIETLDDAVTFIEATEHRYENINPHTMLECIRTIKSINNIGV